MKDICSRAREKARQRIDAMREQAQRPPDDSTMQAPSSRLSGNRAGTGFETERARAKQALRDELSAQRGQSVRKIAAESSTQADERILRVAAYCRVSPDIASYFWLALPHAEGCYAFASDYATDIMQTYIVSVYPDGATERAGYLEASVPTPLHTRFFLTEDGSLMQAGKMITGEVEGVRTDRYTSPPLNNRTTEKVLL